MHLRLRGQVDDETFQSKRLEQLDRRTRLQQQVELPEKRPAEQLERLQRILRFAASVPRMFEIGDGVQRRLILETMTSNWKVKDGIPLCTAKQRFSLLASASSRPTWWATCRLVLTWLLESEAFVVPALPGEGADWEPGRPMSSRISERSLKRKPP